LDGNFPCDFSLLYAGLDGCFIKLCTGAQILAATGRDGNNNMYPIAFAVVPKEDTANWCWFLTQLKYALGGDEGKFGKYTFMSDRQKVCYISHVNSEFHMFLLNFTCLF
jgi:hypothetical protein